MRIVSWNIQWGRGADGRVDLVRTVDTLQAMGSADVICLQEVAVNFPGLKGGRGEDEVAFFRTAFADYTPVFGAGTDVPDGAGGRSQFGNLLLSRRPVGQVFRHLLPWPADAEVPSMQRVCVEAVVEDNCARPLRILTTHLEYYSARQRMAQADALRHLQSEAAGHAEDRPGDADATFGPRPRPPSAVLCGDFNCEPQSPEHARLVAPLDAGVPSWVDAWTHYRPGEPHPDSVGLHGAEWPERRYCCDFFFVTADIVDRIAAVEINQDTAASDHQPGLLKLND